MKLADFKNLCQQQWERDPRADVTEIILSDSSYREFWTDYLLACDGSVQSLVNPGELVSPITRSVVKIQVRFWQPEDQARVLVFGPDGKEETVNVRQEAQAPSPA